MARPRLAGCAARLLALVLLAFRASCYDRPRVVRLHPGPRLAAHAEYEVSWTATDLGTADYFLDGDDGRTEDVWAWPFPEAATVAEEAAPGDEAAPEEEDPDDQE